MPERKEMNAENAERRRGGELLLRLVRGTGALRCRLYGLLLCVSLRSLRLCVQAFYRALFSLFAPVLFSMHTANPARPLK
jgi:hypothetical protein